MHEAAQLSDRNWGYFMAMKTRGARIELNSAGGEVGAEGAQPRAVEGELNALRAGFRSSVSPRTGRREAARGLPRPIQRSEPRERDRLLVDLLCQSAQYQRLSTQ